MLLYEVAGLIKCNYRWPSVFMGSITTHRKYLVEKASTMLSMCNLSVVVDAIIP